MVCLTSPALASAQGLDTVCSQANAADKPDVCGTNNTEIAGSNGVIVKITRLVAIATGTASVIMVMVGGYKYITSTGDPQRVQSAKNTILYALGGLLVSAFAAYIVGYAVKFLT